LFPGIKGWHLLSSANNTDDDHCVGGIELFIRFSQQEDRRRMIDSAKLLGWIEKNSFEEENFFDGKFFFSNKMKTFFFSFRSQRSRMFSENLHRSYSNSSSTSHTIG